LVQRLEARRDLTDRQVGGLKDTFDKSLSEIRDSCTDLVRKTVSDAMTVVDSVFSFCERAHSVAVDISASEFKQAMYNHAEGQELWPNQVPAVMRRYGIYSRCGVDVNDALVDSYKAVLVPYWGALTGESVSSRSRSIPEVLLRSKLLLRGILAQLYDAIINKGVSVGLKQEHLMVTVGSSEDVQSLADEVISRCESRLNECCDEALSSLSRVVKAELASRYELISRYSGEGCIARMKDAMSKHITKKAEKIFSAVDSSLTGTARRELKDALKKTLEESLQQLWPRLQNRFAPLWLNVVGMRHVDELLGVVRELNDDIEQHPWLQSSLAGNKIMQRIP
jgi:hypothetical protein